jgi:hypothetical protein
MIWVLIMSLMSDSLEGNHVRKLAPLRLVAEDAKASLLPVLSLMYL